MVKNPIGLLRVAGLFLGYLLLIIVMAVLTVSLYAAVAWAVIFVVVKSYPILGEPWFFIFWPSALLSVVGYKLFKHIRTVRERRRLYWSQTK